MSFEEKVYARQIDALWRDVRRTKTDHISSPNDSESLNGRDQ